MAQKVIVFHRGYGCETGCCGHSVVLVDPEEFEKNEFDPEYGNKQYGQSSQNFEFAHPYSDSEEDRLAFAKRMVIKTYGEDHVKDLDWEHSFVTDNCEY